MPRRRHLECGRIARSRRGGGGRAGDLGPCRLGPTPAEPPRGSANVKIAQGKGNPEGNRGGTGTGQWPKGTNRRTPDEGKPEEGGRREEPGGQPGNRRKARRGNRRPCDEAPDRPVRARGFGAAPLLRCRWQSPWRVCVNCATSSTTFPADTAVCQSRFPNAALPGSAYLHPLRSADRRPQLNWQLWLLAYPPNWMLARRTALPLRPRRKAYSAAPRPLAPGMDTTCWNAPACPCTPGPSRGWADPHP